MTVHTAHPSRHVSATSAGLGLVGLLVATVAGFAVVDAISDRAAPATPDPVVTQVDPPSGVRDSWEGRIGPSAVPGGVRDSWMPAGATDAELDRFGRR